MITSYTLLNSSAMRLFYLLVFSDDYGYYITSPTLGKKYAAKLVYIIVDLSSVLVSVVGNATDSKSLQFFLLYTRWVEYFYLLSKSVFLRFAIILRPTLRIPRSGVLQIAHVVSFSIRFNAHCSQK